MKKTINIIELHLKRALKPRMAAKADISLHIKAFLCLTANNMNFVECSGEMKGPVLTIYIAPE